MKMTYKTNEEEAPQPLLISCFDTVDTCDKVTFYSYLFQGLHVTYWHEETEDEDERIAGMFDILFQEMMRRRECKGNLPLRNKKL